MIRNYINHELATVKLVGCGRNKEYKHDGFSHWSDDEIDILNFFCNLNYYKPKNNEDLHFCFDKFLYNEKPSYMSLSKELF
jgi:transketolase C-terminal domain/subunit